MSKFNLRSRLLSFKYAFNGLCIMFRNEYNAWIHLSFSLIAIGLGIYLKIETMEWVAIVLCFGIVFAAELFNTAIEQLANYIQANKDERIGDIKDLAAGAVLMAAISALIVGSIIFAPKIYALLAI